MSNLYNTPVSELPKDTEPELPETEPVTVRVDKPKEPYFVGFTVNLIDWSSFTDDLSDEEAGKLLRALLSYCQTGERETFEDRALRLFFNQQCSVVDEQRDKYQTAIKQMRKRA